MRIDGKGLIDRTKPVQFRFDGKDYAKHAKGPGHVLDRFNNSLGSHSAIAAQ